MREEPSSEAFCLDPQLGAGLLSLCVRHPLPFRGAGKSLQSGSMQPVLTAPQSGVGLRRRCQPHSPLFLLSLLTKVPRADRNDHPQASPFSGAGDGSHLPVSAGLSFPFTVCYNKGVCAVPLPPPGPGGTCYRPAGVTLDKLLNVFQTEFLRL